MLPLQFCTLAPKAITTSNARTLCNRTNQKVQNHQKLMMWWLPLGDCFVQHFNPWTCNKSFVLILLTTVVLMKDFTLESTLIQVCSVGKWNLEIRFTEIRILGSVVFFLLITWKLSYRLTMVDYVQLGRLLREVLGKIGQNGWGILAFNF